MPKRPGRPRKHGPDKGNRVTISLTLKRRAILGRISPYHSEAIYQLIDSFGSSSPPEALQATISQAQASAATNTGLPAPEAHKGWILKCTRCQRIQSPACPACRVANGLPP